MIKRRRLLQGLLILGGALLAGLASAQGYPARPIKLILPFAPGSPSDMVGRTIGQKMGAQMGQQLGTVGGDAGANRWERRKPGEPQRHHSATEPRRWCVSIGSCL